MLYGIKATAEQMFGIYKRSAEQDLVA